MTSDTFFAPSERKPIEEILNEKELIAVQKTFTELFGSLSGISAIINSCRQIVFANDEFLSLLGFKSLDAVLGKRPGEVISCVNASSAPGGCGTGEACRYCGVVSTILESIRSGRKVSGEARLTSETEGKIKSWDLKVTSAPIKLNGSKLYALSLQDISNEKKMLTIERVFFHDLLNTAGGLNGLLTIMKMGTAPGEMQTLLEQSEAASQVIVEEIISFRQLRAAENGDINVIIGEVNTLDLLKTAVSRISFHEVGQGKQIVISNKSVDCILQTDKLLLQRVIINLVKNALEASDINGVVTVSAREEGSRIIFCVHNNGVIPENVRTQIFQRSFSTKDKNRGVGTYSVRLMTENYLRGKVSFTSNEAEGTIFSVELNKNWDRLPD